MQKKLISLLRLLKISPAWKRKTLKNKHKKLKLKIFNRGVRMDTIILIRHVRLNQGRQGRTEEQQ